jgi:thymidylate synthase (FAD)
MEIKVLDHGFVKLIDWMGDDSSIVQAARVSYGAGTKTKREDAALINYLWKHQHLSPFEMCEVKLHVKLPIFIARQWVRHRTANINEYSGRYSVMKPEFYIPQRLLKQSTDNKQCSSQEEVENSENLIKLMTKNCNDAYKLYETLLEQGVSRELARTILPLNTYTEWYWKIDLRNLFNFLKLRLDPTASLEIQEYARVIAEIVDSRCPLAYAAFKEGNNGD